MVSATLRASWLAIAGGTGVGEGSGSADALEPLPHAAAPRHRTARPINDAIRTENSS